jgi:hypothetical protein
MHRDMREHDVLARIVFGPFVAQYHREAIDERFRASFREFLNRELMPQVSIDYESMVGTLAAKFDHDRNCGPNSAVRDIYHLRVEFRRGDVAEYAAEELVYDTRRATWRARRQRPRPITLQTLERQSRHSRIERGVGEIIASTQTGDMVGAVCPGCNAPLDISDTDALFAISCPNQCFDFHVHRRGTTREVSQQTFFINPWK